MALRCSQALLGSGGGIKAGRATAHRSKYGMNKGFYSPRNRLVKFGSYASPHKAGYNPKGDWWIKTTMALQQLERPDYQMLEFKQHGDFASDMEHLTTKKVFIPTLAKEEYEAWKVANVDAVREHAGRYAIVEWNVQTEAGGEGSGGIVESHTPEEFAEVHFEPTFNSWVDFIPADYGEQQLSEEDWAARDAEHERWSDNDFHDVDEVKQWLNLEDRKSWSLAKNQTPVSSRIVREDAADSVVPKMADPVPRPQLSKFLTFNTTYGFGTEQFDSWFQEHPESLKNQDYAAGYQPKMRLRMELGGMRLFVPDSPYVQMHQARKMTKFFNFVKDIKSQFATVTKVDPAGRAVWVTQGGGDKMLEFTRRRVMKFTRNKHLINIGMPSAVSRRLYLHPDGWTNQVRPFKKTLYSPADYNQRDWSRGGIRRAQRAAGNNNKAAEAAA